jgi:UDP-N-acetyl-D-mannosaminuronic acid dehydrogenase
MSRVCVVGLGYVGLPTAAMLAAGGHEVLGCDLSPAVAHAVNEGRAPFHETGLDRLLGEAVRSGRLRAATVPSPAEFFVIAVPTPLGPGHRADLSCVEAAVDAIAPLLRPGDTVALESTCPVGTTERLAARIAAARPDLRVPRRGAPVPEGCIHLAHCPERVLPGQALRELVENDRLIGGLTEACARRAATFYQGFIRGQAILCEARMAELVKLAENAHRDVNIAFANELAGLCEQAGLDPWQAIALANRHPRVAILRPGAGVGGHCIAVDPWFLAELAPEAAPLIRAARGVNGAKPGQVAARIRAAAARFRAPVVACLGLAYKPDVGDLRESPALAILRDLQAAGITVLASDPCVAPPPGVTLLDAAEAVAQADIVALLVAHTAFRGLDRAVLAEKVVIDAVGLLAEA